MNDPPRRGSSNESERRFHNLAVRHLAGGLNAEERGELNCLLADEPSRCETLQTFAWQARLIASRLTPDMLSDATIADAISSSYDAAVHEQRPLIPSSLLGQGWRPGVTGRGVAWFTSILLVGYFAVLATLVVRDRGHRVDRQHVNRLPSEAPAFCEIVAVSDGHWAPGETLAVGDQLTSRTLHLQSGVAELRFSDGASVIVEGPAEFEAQSSSLGLLHRGKLVARVPKQAIGFTVVTPAAKVVDLGTEFGLSADEAGRTEVQVFKGKVSVQPAGMKGSSPIVMRAGEAKRIHVDASGQAVIGNINGERMSWVTTLPGSQQPNFPKSLVAYWSFDEPGVLVRERHRTNQADAHHGQFESAKL